MLSRTRIAVALAVLTALFVVPAALAKGGGTTTTPAPAPSASYCPQDPDQWVVAQPDGSTIFANEVSGAGCVFVRSYLAGYLRLDSVVLAPGWTYVVLKNGEGTSSRVELQFTETATGNKVDFRTEYGKTRIG
ncbi:MAG: hypothetical protein ACJ743_03660 [Gaiellaceae bacterium]